MQYKTNHIQDLINRCLKNEQAAYYEVYNRYHHAMYNTSYRILQDEMEAEDVMQESFLVAFQKLDTFKRKSKYGKDIIPFGSWLKRIVINRSINQLRKNKNFVTTDLQIIKDEVEESDDNEFTNQKVEVILNALNDLKPNYKLALTLYLIDGYNYEEIGEILQISYQNCRTIISRAKSKLRKNILYTNA